MHIDITLTYLVLKPIYGLTILAYSHKAFVLSVLYIEDHSLLWYTVSKVVQPQDPFC